MTLLRLVGVVIVGSLIMLASGGYAAMRPDTYYVATNGDDDNAGSRTAPFATLQHALDRAYPGDMIVLTPGVYYQDAVSRRAGTAAAPITISGPPTAILKGAGADRILQITHDHLTLAGFTIDGLWGDPDSARGYRNKLLYVQGSEPRDGVNGLRVLGMTFANAGGECIRLRYFAHQNEIAYTTIRNCGVYDYRFAGDGKNGEGIYIGTAVNQRDDGRNPTDDPDASHENWIHHNRIDTQGNECVNIKEAAWGNLVEYNTCTGQRDPDAAGINIQGHANIVRANTIYDNIGAGIRLGGATERDGINNRVYANVLRANQAGGIKVQALPQDRICGNRFAANPAGAITGSYGDRFEAGVPCPELNTAPAPTPALPTAAAIPQSQADRILAVATITASDDDGNLPANTRDNDLTTRWSAEGSGQYIQYDLGRVARITQVAIAFHKGDQRSARFHIAVSSDGRNWTRVLADRSSGNTLQAQVFNIPDQRARYVRIIGFGNSENDWHSLSEVVIYGAAEG
ncbi:MAG: DUF1565 domain-containing protein [Oscillochloris sp.]|nr:DUF1565 domain-containing protein [Oscillochloris sp.]